jgi:hypothetical protein
VKDKITMWYLCAPSWHASVDDGFMVVSSFEDGDVVMI